MSLRGQFFLSVVLALLVSLSVLGVVALGHARASVGTEMAMALNAGDRIVDNALLSLPSSGQDTYLDRLVRSFDGNRHLRVALIEAGRAVTVSRPATPDPVPDWYRRLLEISVQERLDTAPQLGRRILRVSTDAHNEIGEDWTQFRDGATILGLFSLLVLGLLHLAMTRVSVPLRRLTSGFEAVGGGEYDTQVVSRGPKEISILASAFNRMTTRLKRLEDANRRLTGQMLAIQEEERADLARDLHDEMGPLLFAMRLDAEAIQAEADKSQQNIIAERTRALSDAISRIQTHVRSILKQLRPDGLAETALKVSLSNLVTFWQRHHDSLAIHLDIAADGFGSETDAALYRLVQESLTNAVRHGAATEVWIKIAISDGTIRLSVEDNGIGFVARDGSGLGLRGMRERLLALNGEMQLGTRSGGGTRLQATVPIALAAEAIS